MRDRVKDRVNVSIDHDIKRMFEDLMEIHGRKWNEVVEEKALEVIMSADPVQALQYHIKMGEERNEEMRRALVRAETILPELKEKAPKVDLEIEKRREERWQKESAWLSKQVIRGDVNWNRIMWTYEFDSKKEALAWFRRHINVHDSFKELK